MTEEELINAEKEIFENSWQHIYKKLFDRKEIRDKLANNTVMQIIVWNSQYKLFYPSYPIYHYQKSSKIDKNLKQYMEYIRGNYDSFTFAKLIQKHNISKDIYLLLHSDKPIKIENNFVSIPICDSADITQLANSISLAFNLSEGLSIRGFSIYLEKLNELLETFDFQTIVFNPILDEGKVIGVVSIFSEIKDYNTKELLEIKEIATKQIQNFNRQMKQAKENIKQKNIDKEKRKRKENYIMIKNIVSSIMSRNISHNIGSHVLVNVENIMNNTPINEHKKLINYILERMSFITQVSTLWSPKWSLPRFFRREIIQQFLEQKHILYNIVTTDGLKYIDELKFNECDSSYYIISKPASKKEHNFKIIGAIPSNQELPYDTKDDILVDIPGGKIGYHALYTIIENILRNSAKYGFATLSTRYQKKQMELNIHINEEEADHTHRIQIWDNVSYISNLKYSFDIDNIKKEDIELISIEEIINEPFILIKLNIKNEVISIYVHKITTNPQNNTWLIPCSPKFEYKKKLETKNNFFISEARFHSILKNLSGYEYNRYQKFHQQTLLKRAKDILHQNNLLPFIKLSKKRLFNPLHHTINTFLQEPLIDTQKDINRNNGLSEIKICALYLSGDSFEDLAKNYKKENKNRKYIKSIAKPDFDKNKNLLCYRLGYEFILNKPTIYSLYLSKEFKERLSFIESCSDDSFVLVKDISKQKSTIRKISKIISSEFLIFDFKKFKKIISKENHIDKLNELPYRIIVLTNNESEEFNKIVKENKPFTKRVAQLNIAECKDKEKFKEKILNTWIQHILNVNRYSQIETSLNLNGVNNFISDNVDTEIIAKDLLKKFAKKLTERGYISKDNIEKIIDFELSDILFETKFQQLFENDKCNQTTIKTNYIDEVRFSFILKNQNSSYKQKAIVLSRHAPSKEEAKKEAQIDKEILYYEPLSGITNQFWLYKYMFKENKNNNEYLFNKLKLLETALYKIAIFDERLNNIIDAKQAREQNLYIINEINGYRVSDSSYALTGEFEYNKIIFKDKQSSEKVNIDILIIHYGLIEKIKDNSKLSESELKKLLSSFPMVVLTSGRGIILDSSIENITQSYAKNNYIKFISYPVLKEYFKNNAINKIGLTQMLMNLIGIKNRLSGLYDE